MDGIRSTEESEGTMKNGFSKQNFQAWPSKPRVFDKELTTAGIHLVVLLGRKSQYLEVQ
jgi:hypothetical protein